MSPPKDEIDPIDLFYRIKALEEWKGELRVMFQELISKVDSLRTQIVIQPIGISELERRIAEIELEAKSSKEAVNKLYRLYYIVLGGVTVITVLWAVAKEFIN